MVMNNIAWIIAIGVLLSALIGCGDHVTNNYNGNDELNALKTISFDCDIVDKIPPKVTCQNEEYSCESEGLNLVCDPN
jgi:hypothetical protein